MKTIIFKLNVFLKIIRITMKDQTSNKGVIFCTFSDYQSNTTGDAINDRKLIKAIPMNYKKIVIYPKYSKNKKVLVKSAIKFFASYLKEIAASDNIFITRGGKLAILPIILNKVFKNKIILRLGCTPLMFVEREAFLKNENFFLKFLYYFEPNFEKFALRHVSRCIVENVRAKRIILHYGAKPDNIKIIPYYIQQYFLNGKNPSFDNNKDIFKIGYTGRFQKYDFLVPVINAISLLKREKNQIKLYLIGDGPNRKNIERLVKEQGLADDIIFLGIKSHKEVSKLITDYHCLILPMVNKLCPSTISLKILEGVMKGKIVITTNSGNNPSLFLKNTDLILKNTSSDDVFQKLKLVINDYDKYRRISEKLSEYHSNIRSKSIYEKKLEEILSESTY